MGAKLFKTEQGDITVGVDGRQLFCAYDHSHYCASYCAHFEVRGSQVRLWCCGRNIEIMPTKGEEQKEGKV